MYADSGYKDTKQRIVFTTQHQIFLSLMFKFYYSTVCFHFIHYIYLKKLNLYVPLGFLLF